MEPVAARADRRAYSGLPAERLFDHHSFAPWRCGAGTAELDGYDASINALRCEAILSRALQLFPALARAGPVQYWAGLRPATPANAPLVGRTRYRNLYLNTGHGTLGWTLACGCAQALADIVSGIEHRVSYAFAG